jgi:hypothetical protein
MIFTNPLSGNITSAGDISRLTVPGNNLSVYGTDVVSSENAAAQQAFDWTKELQSSAMAFNSAEAEKNRKWLTDLSNSAYQRSVADLKKAGLNPILAAYNSGASTPASSTASVNSTSASKANVASAANAANNINTDLFQIIISALGAAAKLLK